MRLAQRSIIALLLLVAMAAPQVAATVRGSDEHSDEHSAFIDVSAITVGLEAGDEGEGVQALQEFLEMAGFLVADSAIDGVFDQATTDALKAFQNHHRLRATGTVTEQTIQLVQTPRFDDHPDIEVEPGRSLAYTTGNSWGTNNLTYAFNKFTPDLDQNSQRAAMQAAFDTWAAVTPLTFTEVSSTSSADIVISFESGSHGDPCNPASACAFDGPSGTLAHAFYPPPNGGSIAGDTHFDDAETWTLTIPVPAGGFDLKSVAIHEFGHSLGLGHSSVEGATMYPYYSGADHSLHSDDIAGIQSLYGANSGGGGETVDAQVVSVSMSPSTTTVGTSVSGSVQVRNNGTQAAAIPVSVSGPSGFSYNQTTSSVAAGQSATVGFTWTPGSAGNFTLTATANLSGDSDSGNNSATSNTVTVSSPPQQTVDAEVTSASASPTGITQNSGNVTISATIRNNGSASAAIPVSVSGPNGWSNSTTRTLNAGASATVQFSWPASAVGTHTFTVSTSLSGDQIASNNSRTTNSVSVTSPAPSGTDLYISGVSITASPASGGHNMQATVSIGPNGSAGANAYMYGYWIHPNGQYKFGYGYANGSGQVTLQMHTSQTGEHKFRAYRVSKSGYTYNSALNTGNPGSVNVGAGTPPATIDASVNQVTASPTSIVLNSGNVSIVATVGNNGDNSASIPVSISGPDGFSNTQNVSVAAGATGQVTFSWPANVAGSHTFSVSTNLSGDSNAVNDQRNSPSVTVTQASVIDAEVVTVTRSTSSVEQNGSTVTLTANVRNNGTSNATFNVRLSSGTASVNTTKPVTLAPNASQAVQFQWTPTILGNHTFTATTELASDSNSSNNTKSTTVNVTAPSPAGGAQVFVERIYTLKAGANWYVYVFVDSTEGSVGTGATITATLRSQYGQTRQYVGGTKSGGYSIMVVTPLGSGTHTFKVDNITLSGHTYNPALDSQNPTTLQ